MFFVIAGWAMKIKTAASRTSRHKKKYWRKGTDVADIERTLRKSVSFFFFFFFFGTCFSFVFHWKLYLDGGIKDKPNHELFTIDRTPSAEVKKYTKRQQAALDKISRSIRFVCLLLLSAITIIWVRFLRSFWFFPYPYNFLWFICCFYSVNERRYHCLLQKIPP